MEDKKELPVALYNGEYLDKAQLWELLCDEEYVPVASQLLTIEQSHIIGSIRGDLVFRLADYTELVD